MSLSLSNSLIPRRFFISFRANRIIQPLYDDVEFISVLLWRQFRTVKVIRIVGTKNVFRGKFDADGTFVEAFFDRFNRKSSPAKKHRKNGEPFTFDNRKFRRSYKRRTKSRKFHGFSKKATRIAEKNVEAVLQNVQLPLLDVWKFQKVGFFLNLTTFFFRLGV